MNELEYKLHQTEIVLEAPIEMPEDWAIHNALQQCISVKKNIRLQQGKKEVLIKYDEIVKFITMNFKEGEDSGT